MSSEDTDAQLCVSLARGQYSDAIKLKVRQALEGNVQGAFID